MPKSPTGRYDCELCHLLHCLRNPRAGKYGLMVSDTCLQEIDDIVGEQLFRPEWFKTADWVPAGCVAMQGSDGKWTFCRLGKEEDMSSSQTFAYEVLVPEKLDFDDCVVREAKLIDAKTGVIKRPTRDGLLMKYAAQILEAGITEETAGDVCITIGHSIANPFRD